MKTNNISNSFHFKLTILNLTNKHLLSCNFNKFKINIIIKLLSFYNDKI